MCDTERKRVVVTGVGAVSGIGIGAAEVHAGAQLGPLLLPDRASDFDPLRVSRGLARTG